MCSSCLILTWVLPLLPSLFLQSHDDNPTSLNPRTAGLFARLIMQRTLTNGTICDFCHPCEFCFNFLCKGPYQFEKGSTSRHTGQTESNLRKKPIDVRRQDIGSHSRDTFDMTSQRNHLNDNFRKVIIVNFFCLTTFRARHGHERSRISHCTSDSSDWRMNILEGVLVVQSWSITNITSEGVVIVHVQFLFGHSVGHSKDIRSYLWRIAKLKIENLSWTATYLFTWWGSMISINRCNSPR